MHHNRPQYLVFGSSTLNGTNGGLRHHHNAAKCSFHGNNRLSVQIHCGHFSRAKRECQVCPDRRSSAENTNYSVSPPLFSCRTAKAPLPSCAAFCGGSAILTHPFRFYSILFDGKQSLLCELLTFLGRGDMIFCIRAPFVPVCRDGGGEK